ncbi:hypothetical protein [Nonomuraea sp. NPDC049646]|uniref:hypothetical protein n=1 Tax=unclassified Nonomuraea TaxID=2593643 RepID=UPI0037AEA78E
MHDPTETDRQEILSGPGSSPRPPGKSRKTAVIAALALVGVLAAGGAGYLLAAKPGQSVQQEQGSGRPSPGTSAGDEVFEADEDATMGDATTDAPDDGLPADGSDDSAMGDAVTDPGGGSDPADKGSTGSDGTAQKGTGGKPGTPSTKAPQPAGDDPADGPAGQLSGQCAKSGC